MYFADLYSLIVFVNLVAESLYSALSLILIALSIYFFAKSKSSKAIETLYATKLQSESSYSAFPLSMKELIIST